MTEVSNEAKDEGQAGSNAPTVEELMARVAALESNKGRIISESKTYKEKFQAAKDRLDAIEQEKLAEQGKWQELLKKNEEKLMETQATLAKKEKEAMQASMRFQVTRFANDAHDVNDLLTQREFVSKLELDETGEVNAESVKAALDEFRKAKPYMFKGRNIAPQLEGKPAFYKEEKKDMNSMSRAEQENALLESLKQIL